MTILAFCAGLLVGYVLRLVESEHRQRAKVRRYILESLERQKADAAAWRDAAEEMKAARGDLHLLRDRVRGDLGKPPKLGMH